MAWIDLQTEEGIEQIREASHNRPQLIFKHSTRCGISSGAKMRMEDQLDALSEKFDVHYLDLIAFRSVSNQIADTFGVHHQSPQVLLIHKGDSVYDSSHGRIQPNALLDQVAQLS